MRSSCRRNTLGTCTFAGTTSDHERAEDVPDNRTAPWKSRWPTRPACLPDHWYRHQYVPLSTSEKQIECRWWPYDNNKYCTDKYYSNMWLLIHLVLWWMTHAFSGRDRQESDALHSRSTRSCFCTSESQQWQFSASMPRALPSCGQFLNPILTIPGIILHFDNF